MKKYFKSGFSLAELLITLGIISIIATMGFTISKKGVESAYKLYIYSGYKGIQDAFITTGATESPSDETKTINPLSSEGKQFIADLFNGTLSGNVIEAPNHIKYTITSSGSSSLLGNMGTVKMEVPATKHKRDGAVVSNEIICLKYAEKIIFPLMPYSDSSCKTTIDNIQERKDLMPFYIDDGEQGRVIYPKGASEGSTDIEYTPIVYMSFKEAMTKNYTAEECSAANIGISGCSGAEETSNPIKIENPRKAY